MAQWWKRMSKPVDGDAARLEASSSVRRTIAWRQAAASVLTRDRLNSDAVNGKGRPGLRAGLVILFLLGLLIGLYGGILRDLARQWWDDPNYTHGFLVPLFSGFLVWQRRKELTALPRKGSWG